ncbi:MFS transporter [Nocardia sp. NBC_00403]|uniref:MFS transporter n=1 Tax=Nocardia sp. NBC_00403 TaxID=2975990 RepID=UPI002E1E6EFC
MRNSSIHNNRGFLLLWSGNAVSHIGLQGVRLAYPLLALGLTGSPISAGWVGFALTLPSLIFEVPAGVAADYWDRRRMLMMCQRIGLAATLLVAAVIVVRPPGLSLFLAVAAFIEGTAYVFFNIGELGLVRDIVSEDERPAAFAFLEAEQPIANMVGRTLGAAAFGIARSLPFLANAASYLFCLWTLSKMRDRVPETPDVNGPKPARFWDWNHAWGGVRSVWAEPFVRPATAIIGATNIIFQVLILLTTVKIRDAGHPAWVVGLVLGVTGLGGLFGAAPAAGLASRISPRIVLTGTLWTWVVLCVPIAVSSNPAVLAVCWMGVGFTAPIVGVALTLYRVRAFSEDLVSRVFGATKLITHGGSALGALLAGFLLSTLGTSASGWALVTGMVLLARMARRLPEPRTITPATQPSVAQRPTNWIAGLSRNGPNSPSTQQM